MASARSHLPLLSFFPVLLAIGCARDASFSSQTHRPQLAAANSAAPMKKADVSTATLIDASYRSYELVRELTDLAGPRPAGSTGDRIAAEWAVATMKKARFQNVHTEPVRVRRWERGAESAEIVSPAHHKLAIAGVGGSVPTPPGGMEGEVIEVDSKEALEKLDPAKAKGKIVFINVPTRRTRDGAGYGETAGLRYRGAGMAAKVGASAVVLRSIATDQNRLPHTGAKGKDEIEIPIAALSVPDAELLHRHVAAKPTRIRLSLANRVVPEEMSANVLGELVGREHPDEIVLVGAHIDSWDLGTGAIDDGAGCAIILDAVRVLAEQGIRPRRTIRVVLFASEEAGLDGSKAYAEKHRNEFAKHVVALEADAGADRVLAAQLLGDPEKRVVFERTVKLLAPLSVEVDSNDAWGGSDLLPLRTDGVPIVQLKQDATRYFDIHHTANDTFDKIEKDAIHQATAAYAVFLWAIANEPDNLGRLPEAKRAVKY